MGGILHGGLAGVDILDGHWLYSSIQVPERVRVYIV